MMPNYTQRQKGLQYRTNTHQLIACVAELEIRCRGSNFVDKAIDYIAQSSVFISLQVCLQVVFHEAFVNLGFL
jgi:hypothetical protein